MAFPLATESPRIRASRQTPNPRSVFAVKGGVRRTRPRAKNDGLPAPRKVWSRIPLCRIRESPPAPLPTAVATMLLPRYFYQDLARGKQRRSPRRNFRGAERPPFQLSLTRGGPRRHTCPPVPTLRGLVF